MKLWSKRRRYSDPGEEDKAERPSEAEPPDIVPPDPDKIRHDERKGRFPHVFAVSSDIFSRFQLRASALSLCVHTPRGLFVVRVILLNQNETIGIIQIRRRTWTPKRSQSHGAASDSNTTRVRTPSLFRALLNRIITSPSTRCSSSCAMILAKAAMTNKLTA